MLLYAYFCNIGSITNVYIFFLVDDELLDLLLKFYLEFYFDLNDLEVFAEIVRH